MKAIDLKSALIGGLATVLFLTLTSGKQSEDKPELQFFTPLGYGAGGYNKSSGMLYLYRFAGSAGEGYLDQKPREVYKVAANGSGFTK